MKINTDLERVGDQAVNIAQGVIKLLAQPPLKPALDIAAHGGDRRRHDARQPDAFVRTGRRAGAGGARRDDEVDELQDGIFRVLLTYMMADPGTIERALALILVSRNLERIADHATNIAEDVIFVVEGRVVRHGGGTISRPVPQ